MQRAGTFDGDLRSLRGTGAVKRRERPERHGPPAAPVQLIPNQVPSDPIPSGFDPPQALNAPAPPTLANFDGLDHNTWGAGHPPDTNGDVGPDHFIQSLNSSIGIYAKTGGAPVAAFTIDTLMSQGNFGNLCDTDNFGDPVVLYDTFEDRWVISDFAFTLDGSNNVVNPPGAFECFAVSKTGDPVTGGWNFYSINTIGGLGDYPKLGIWPDGLYMSVNMFDYAAAGSFQNVRLYALNKAQMYAGAPWIQIVGFDVPAGEFTLLPSNARLQTGTPPPGSPNYFTSVWNYLNVVGVWKFHVDWNNIPATTLTGPFNSVTATNWSELTDVTVQSPAPGNQLDTLFPRLMMQNQYTNLSGVESLWNSHTVGASGATSTQAAVRYYQVPVTGGIVTNATQAATYSPDTTHRFMPSVAVDSAGNMAIGYSATSTSLMPAIRYAGRLAVDPPNTITQTEVTLHAGTGTQDGNCGPSSCERWGDYSTMTLDPDGCTFWYTNEYYQVTGLNYRTRIGSFSFASCTPVGLGALQGTVKNAFAAPIAGATVMLGSRMTTTDAGGNYSFSDLSAGTYPGATASFAGYTAATFTAIVVPSGGSVTRDFVLGPAPQTGCLTDTMQGDFQTGTFSGCDPTSSPGDVQLARPLAIDQQNPSITNNGFGFTNTSWAGQTFTPAVSGALTRADLFLFCAGCTGSTSDLTVSIRATSGSPPVPTGPDLAVATIPAFSSGAGGFFTALFASPTTLTAGTRYAVIVRAISPISAGSYAYACSCGSTGPNSGTNPYANGQRVTSGNSGGVWIADTAQGGRDLGFVTFMQSGFTASGTFESSLKDANPAVGASAVWSALSWTATTPAGTTVQFQAAASNNAAGPFWFVGPDGTPGTFFSSGASLAQFNGSRYLKYRAVLTTSNSSVTPAIHDVTVCFDNASSPSSPSASINPGFLWFGTREVTSTSLPQSVTVTNSGPGSLVISTFDGAPATSLFSIGDFQGTTTCPLAPASLAQGLSCALTFQFSPTGNGSRVRFLSIGSNAAEPLFLLLDGIGFTIDAAGVAQLLANGGMRLHDLQNPDGGWFSRAGFDTQCGAGLGVSCPNLAGINGLGVLSAWERTGNTMFRTDAIEAGELLQAIHAATPAQQPFSQDLEFLRALSVAAADSQYADTADEWFGTITAVHPVAADRADWAFARRDAQRIRTLAVWDLASTIRSAKAAGDNDYANGLAARVIAREADWKDVNPLHRWDMCADSAGCGPADNKRAFDYTLLGMGSLIWAIHDLSDTFDVKVDEYKAWLLAQQDASGSWDAGNLQITAYAGMGLGAVGGAGTAVAVENAVRYFFENEFFGGGWPFTVTNGIPNVEFTNVDSEVMRGVAMMFSTQQGSSVTVTPSQLATVTFTEVTAAGTTSIVSRPIPSSVRVPAGYSLASGLKYQVTTTAATRGNTTVCLSMNWNALEGNFDRLRILQVFSPGNSPARFVDRTILSGAFAPDASKQRVCASLPSLEPIAVSILRRGKK